jgi:hypothetical protein
MELIVRLAASALLAVLLARFVAWAAWRYLPGYFLRALSRNAATG